MFVFSFMKAEGAGQWPELGGLLTNCNPLLIPDYMTKIVVSNVIITLHTLGNIIRLLLDYFWINLNPEISKTAPWTHN